MDATTSQTDLNTELQKRFKALPKVIQTAITSADVQKELRALADTNKLHLDQWQLLENDVMLTLLGLQTPEELPHHLKDDLDISAERAGILSQEISRIVFAPIRAQLERELEHPDAKAATVSDVEGARAQALTAETSSATPATPPVLPATPPAEAPTGKIERAPISESYKAGETSVARKTVHDDPYREPPA